MPAQARTIEGFSPADPLERPLRIEAVALTNLTSVRERLERRSRRRRNTNRFRQIASVAVRYGLADQLRKMPGKRMQQWLRGSAGQSIVDLSTPVRIRLALSDLGTTFIKFGQMLSTRPDLVGQDVAAELTHLQSHTPPDPGAAEATIEKELGSPPADPVRFVRADAVCVGLHRAGAPRPSAQRRERRRQGSEGRHRESGRSRPEHARGSRGAGRTPCRRPEAVPPGRRRPSVHEDDARRARLPARAAQHPAVPAQLRRGRVRPLSGAVSRICAHDAS